MHYLKNIKLIVMATALGLSACNNKSDENKKKNEPVKILAEDSMDAEQLALAGEQLVSVTSFMLADKVFDMSLAKDKDNFRANFYKKFLGTQMYLRGLAVRIRPLMRANGQLSQFTKEFESYPSSALKSFLADGVEDIRDYKSLQNIFDQQRDAWEDFRRFLKDNSGRSLTINVNPYVMRDSLQNETANYCRTLINRENRIEVACDFSNILERKLNSADFAMMSQYAAFVVFYQSLFYTSYSWEGIEELQKSNIDGLSYKQKKEFLKKNFPQLGKLRANNGLNLIRNLGADYSVAAKWAIQYQRELCNPMEPENLKRRGFLFSRGFCIKDVDGAEKSLVMFDQALAGALSLKVSDDSANGVRDITISPFAIFDHPVEHLSQFFPESLDSCGNPVSYADPTLGGLLPNGDAVELLRRSCN